MSDQEVPQTAEETFVDFDVFATSEPRVRRPPIKALRLGHPPTWRRRRWVPVTRR